MPKHIFSHSSKAKSSVTRSSIKRKASVPRVKGDSLLRSIFRKIILILGIFIFIFFMICVVFFVFLSAENQNKNILFKINNYNGEYSVLYLAYYDNYLQKTWVYHLQGDGFPTGELDPTKASLALGTIIHEVRELPPINVDVYSQDQNMRRSLLSDALFSAIDIVGFDFEHIWWWWHLRTQSSTQIQEKTFESLDSWLSFPVNRDFQLSQEPCSIAVVNTTDVTGLASQIGQVIERSGLFVARLTNNSTNAATSLVLTKNPDECQEVISALQVITPNFSEVVVDESAANRYRARVVLIIGTDLF